ncbi:ATP synthase subunit I [Psychrosphaera ytuae]|uniref:ATP synthase subunit I n=1 Tax=Psychrosphaera ytuae TaxID=2820710 RepID=A0A975D9V2_9GAMM|nr:ATP synthase subunit I [Psychrosphaera ytuae]QTH62974.1 ATP synthase subunit I [Psychrosphaera ytuae]
MARHLTQQHRKTAFKFVGFQFGLAILLSVLVGFIWEVQIGQSFFIGAMLDVLPSFVFTVYAFRYSGAQQLRMIAASMYRGETVKIIITGALFVAVITALPVVFPALFVGFLIMKISQFLQTIFF